MGLVLSVSFSPRKWKESPNDLVVTPSFLATSGLRKCLLLYCFKQDISAVSEKPLSPFTFEVKGRNGLQQRYFVYRQLSHFFTFEIHEHQYFTSNECFSFASRLLFRSSSKPESFLFACIDLFVFTYVYDRCCGCVVQDIFPWKELFKWIIIYGSKISATQLTTSIHWQRRTHLDTQPGYINVLIC